MDQDCVTEDTFRQRVDIPSPDTLSRTSLSPQPAPPTPAHYLRSDSPSRSLVQICTDAVSKAEAPRKCCAAHTVLCPPASVDEAFYACSPAAALCSSPAFAEVSLVTAPTPAEEVMEQVLNPTSILDASQWAFAPLPVASPSSAVCTPAEKELPAPAPAPMDTIFHTSTPMEVVLPPASMDGVASDAIAPGYIPDSMDVAASPTPLPALVDEAISAPAPVEAAYHTSAPADEAPEPVSDRVGKLHCVVRTVYRMGTVYPSDTVR